VVIGRLSASGSAEALLDRMAREWRLAGVLRVALVDRGGDPNVRMRLQTAGAQDFIAEPLAGDELRARFGLLLEHASLRRRAEAAEAELRRLQQNAAMPERLPEAPPTTDGAPSETATRSDRRSAGPGT
jgi:DNA-binding response OmpR family regulator